ncbi:hypothetical protein DB30_03843 [Enhygromyxa salina]|uniref:Uncharacterized protein n=1 Tax=Enhygromyxa salina TaxID=215803 RepID=A0A0C2DHY5_9BACT|nr:hypothetical protein [Enhygromyxa salina]KIG19287.1 hypothetical protein DB30_03843 [Enhygromyxa salina]
MRLHGGGGYGPTNSSFGAVGAGVALFGHRWRWSVDAGWWLPRTILREQAGGRFQAWWIGTRGCVVPQRGELEFPLCAGMEAGQVFARGLAPAINTRDATSPWIAATLTPAVAWVVTARVAIVAEAGLLLPLGRGSFDVGEQSLASLSPVGIRALLAVELRL